MDVQRTTRERVFSILNDNDSPSFVIKQNQSSTSQPLPLPLPLSSQKLPSISALTAFSPRLERPNLPRNPQFYRNDSISSTGSPPLLRYDSTSSSKSNSSMDSTPSPITPADNYNDTTLVPYDSLLRQDLTMGYLPPSSGITPFMEQSLMIGPVPIEPFHTKALLPLAPATYPTMPTVGAELVQMPTPTLSTNASVSSTSSTHPQPKSAPNNSAANGVTGKKNKYPCPYAQSHNCSATFTTSGHAARHGKKHTGEKGVHCPVCDKAFTRKDNMKQHERTHKNRASNGDEKKSKAQSTREANRAKLVNDDSASQTQSVMPPHPAQIRKSSSGASDPSDISLAPNLVDTPVDVNSLFFSDSTPHINLPTDTVLITDPTTASLYPPLADDTLLAVAMQTANEKLELSVPQPPTLVRGFSDLDTLAQAAESAFDPYFNQAQF